MKNQLKSFVLILIIGAVSARLSDEKCKEYHKDPNVKKDTLISEFPHLGLLGYKDDDIIKYNCPATLISESVAVSPAHCMVTIQGPAKYLLFGPSNSSDNNNRKLFNITEIIVHPNYTRTNSVRQSSLALVKFSPPITPNDNIKPGCLYTKSVDDKQTLTDLLWTRSGSDRILFKDDVSIIPTDSCIERYKKQKVTLMIDDHFFLCVLRKYNRDYVQNIGGTSHVVEDDVPKIVAIDNFGPRIPINELPDVTTKLYHYLDWIEQNVWKK
ncbi:serine protease snake-like isoform X2 [Onthophagus taurus]|uniref:serine protease snake-like isoform X2 n=1 Tax=Onthophagus taurus TaxID=166361 RepID=UPI0039BE3B7A